MLERAAGEHDQKVRAAISDKMIVEEKLAACEAELEKIQQLNEGLAIQNENLVCDVGERDKIVEVRDTELVEVRKELA